jgi:lambda family phage tail tape measure protein
MADEIGTGGLGTASLGTASLGAESLGGSSFGVTEANNLASALDALTARTRSLESGANAFANAMTRAFTSAVSGGKRFEDVLKSLALRLSDIALRMAFKPIEQSIAGGLNNLFSGLFGGSGQSGGAGPALAAAMGAIKPFAGGGVIGTPTYFPLLSGGLGLAGEAGPEAILPLARGADGRLGVAASGGGAPANVTIQISTPDADSFRRSEVYVTGQIARAVARGQRGL